VDAHSLDVLELPAIRRLLAAETSFSASRELGERLEPSADPGEVARRQAETAEGLALVEGGAPPRLRGAHDVRVAASLAARGGRLQPDALAAVAQTVHAGLDVRGTLEPQAALAPRLRARALAVDPALAPLARRLDAAVETDGSGLRDDASPALRSIRRELNDARSRATERLRSLATSSELRAHLQEEFITERGGRPVLAVKASSRSRVPGIVHDTSGSGQTLFVEPFAIVELQNRLRELVAAERDEVDRILTELSGAVGAVAGPLAAAVDALAVIDVAMARAALSARWRGCPVQGDTEVELEGARHPLLDPATAVPIDLPLRGIRAVIVSGPNTGGKTVALKTLGVCALLHQTGLRPPARAARLPVFDQVLADIGDEQSIERSLSTFSGHVQNLKRISASATARSLVLLDEVAAGTDPVEGAALARAYIGALVERGALVLTTTHYAELKEWASAAAGVENAAVGFDPETLAPTYVVMVGRPGASHALQIAERLGLDPDVVEAARRGVAPERRQVEELLAEAAAAERDATRARAAADALRGEAETSRLDAARRERELRDALDAVRAGAAAERQRAREEAETELRAYRRELEALRGEIRAAQRAERERTRRRRAPGPATDQAARERDRRLNLASTRFREAAEALDETLERPAAPVAPLAVGDQVRAPSLGVRGTIAGLAGNQAEVHGGGLRVKVPVHLLERDATARRDRPDRDAVRVRASAPASVERELDVRGRRSDEVREAVRGYVDSAHLAGVPEVVIIHGRATGALRSAVRGELDRHPLVDRHESQSADGATRVLLAGRPDGGASGSAPGREG
jgi:DNA mismatch repair protein MutS2